VDPALGDVMNAGVFIRGTEGYCVTRFNSLGLRAPEPDAVSRLPERILFLGDSFTEAVQVRDQDTFILRSEAALRARGREVACINAGGAGASPAAYLYLAPPLKSAYRPTRVIVQVGDGDWGPQLTGVSQAYWLEKSSSGWTPRRAAASPVPGWQRDLLARVPAAYWLVQKQRLVALNKDAADATTGRGHAGSKAAPDSRIVEWVVRELRSRYGSDVVVLYTPAIDYFGDPLRTTDTEEMVRDACARANVTFLDLRPAFAARYKRTRQPLHGFANTEPGTGHLNVEGHALVAEAITAVLITAPFAPDVEDPGR
jgi:hypothetical protein